jgi:cell division protein FtsI/penicillin-binding protein 2
MNRTRQERVRLGVLFVGIAAFFLLAVARLVQFQVVWTDEYREIVQRQSSGKVSIPAERGMIYDRYGRLVAKNVTRSSLYAHPESERQCRRINTYLEKLFGLRPGQAATEFELKPNRFRWIKRQLDDAVAERVTNEAPPGLYLRDETVREYPFGSVGKQILGYTTIDDEGLSGIELTFDSILAGQSGWADIRRDGLRNTFRVKEQALMKPVPGRSLVLTIDWHLQELVEQELRMAVDTFGAQSGVAVFADCNTGDILSMAHYDPLEKDPDKPVKLYAISDQFEPGSAFKPFTAAALLDAGMINFQEKTYCEQGQWRVGHRILNDDKKHGWLTFREIIEVSSNIGLGKNAIRLEGSDLIETYRSFGFGRRCGTGLPGETPGVVADRKTWSDYTISALAMGHSIAVNALQMTQAMGAIANRGELLQPHLLLGRVDDDGIVNRTAEREVVGRPLKSSSADSLSAFLRGVVEKGTAKPVNSDFVSIAGKTGTAELPNLEEGGYYKNRFSASFCGFFPAHAPVIVGIIVLKDPRPITYGGFTSGVAFRHIAERYTVSNPDLFAVNERFATADTTLQDMTMRAPDLLGREVRQARAIAKSKGVDLHCDSGLTGTVVWQYPPPDRVMLSGDEMLVAAADPQTGAVPMIDLTGLTIRKASAFLQRAGVNVTIEGTGNVYTQSILPGVALAEGQTCRLACRQL